MCCTYGLITKYSALTLVLFVTVSHHHFDKYGQDIDFNKHQLANLHLMHFQASIAVILNCPWWHINNLSHKKIGVDWMQSMLSNLYNYQLHIVKCRCRCMTYGSCSVTKECHLLSDKECQKKAIYIGLFFFFVSTLSLHTV